jgi:hypothetical protein
MAADGSVRIGIEADHSEFDSAMGDVSHEAEQAAGEMESAFQGAVKRYRVSFRALVRGSRRVLLRVSGRLRKKARRPLKAQRSPVRL